ncbi:MAG TPA: hypothetical protein VN512_10080 [Clostridia bacterium]|nr:hypothetical protein [Clostridia bacterium]
MADAKDILFLREKHKEVLCTQPILEYIVSIVNATRSNEKILLGVSPRGSLALMNAAMAHAMLLGRSYTLPDDVQFMAEPVLAHRIVLHPQGSQKKETPETVLSGILRSIKVPGPA